MEINRNHILFLPIENESDIGVCRRKSTILARQLGFGEIKSGEIAIMVTELVTNVLKHGGGKGKILICELSHNQQKAIEIWCCDMGNGIPNVQKAISDGFSNSQSLGIGMGTIRRFSDELEINPSVEPLLSQTGISGFSGYSHCIRTVKWVPSKQWLGQNRHLTVGAASRSKNGETLNGDAFVINHINHDKTIFAVIDGLGHGKEAHIASQKAREQILLKAELPLNNLIQHIHQSIRGTRGAVIGLAQTDTNTQKLSFTGIGNIEGLVFSNSVKKNLLSFGGIVGHNMRTPRIQEFDFKENDLFCLYSDGITSRWRNEEWNWNEIPQKNAEHLINHYSRLNDDATVLIVRYDA